MPADTYTRTPVALAGYPTDLTPADTAITPTGHLRSWADAHTRAGELLAGPGFREHTDATAWQGLVDACRRYVADRGEDPTDLALLAFVAGQVIESARGDRR